VPKSVSPAAPATVVEDRIETVALDDADAGWKLTLPSVEAEMVTEDATREAAAWNKTDLAAVCVTDVSDS